ncbi:flagellar hook-length control protein FliK [Neotabrizicola shimadae]|uniref:Flagellar hook-length control protein FliK n=1 Tax=Neotabrizicola shimadae TaxID=2807096 RepID=A0A8G1EDZ4_9RHOB|nr:flagellar hook-length control protein FliK [Neotabrizicola shimadae]
MHHALCRPVLTASPTAPLAGKAGGTTELELDLAELGPVRMRIKDKRGRLALHVLADHPATLELLRRHADELTGSLREAGFADTTLSWGSAKAGKDAEPSASPASLADLSGAETRAAAQDRDLYILL